MSHWEVREGWESPQSHHNYDTKPINGDPGMPAGISLTKITSELSMFNWQPGGVTGQMSPPGISCTSTTSLCPERCAWWLKAQNPAALGCPQYKPSVCIVCTRFGKHTTRFVFRNYGGVWCEADRTSFFRMFSLWKAVLLKLDSGSKYVPVK